MHHAPWYREIYSYVRVIECAELCQFDVEFIDFEQVKNGIDLISASSSMQAMPTPHGAAPENWKDEKVVWPRRFVDEGGGVIGVVSRVHASLRAYFQLSDVLGVDRELGFSMSTASTIHLAGNIYLEDIPGEDCFGEGKSRITRRERTTRS